MGHASPLHDGRGELNALTRLVETYSVDPLVVDEYIRSTLSTDAVATSLQRSDTALARRVTTLMNYMYILSSESTDEFHDRVRSLPVTVDTWRDYDATGRFGVWKEFINRRGRSLMIFRADDAGSSAARSGDGLRGPNVAARLDNLTWGPHDAVPHASSSTWPTFCEYTDPDQVYWSGECATAQEIDDGIALLLDMDAEYEELYEEICENAPYEDLEDLGCPEHEDEVVWIPFHGLIADNSSVTDMSDPDEEPMGGEGHDAIDHGHVADAGTSEEGWITVYYCADGDCVIEKVGVAAGFSAYLGGAYFFHAALFAVNPVAGAIVATAALTAGALGTLVVNYQHYLDCRGGGSW